MSSYSLATSYLGDALLSGFDWINTTDLSGGFVAYQSQQDALARGLYSVDDVTQAVTIRVDTTNTYAADGSKGGRPSVRIESKVAVNKGLVIGDFAHMPGSVCGSWPAFWMYGPDWPNNGEIDIIEGANTALKNLMSGHTSEGCTLPATGFTGSQGYTDCTSPGSNYNSGCTYVPPDSDLFTYGDDFNSIGGGVYALQWTDDAIKIWHFPRTAIPADITIKEPNPSLWGEPEAVFGGSACDVNEFFNDMSIVLNMDFCGAYAGNLWGVTDNCAVDTSSTCQEWVANHPEAFTNVFWTINYIDVYEAPTSNSSSSSSSTQPATTSTLSTLPASNTTLSTTSSGVYVNQSTTASTTDVATSIPTPTPTGSLTRDPAIIGDFVLLGCFGSNSSFVTFNSAGTDAAMTPEVCVGLCSTSRYAGVFDRTCYCAETLDAASSALSDIDQCDQPCPGNANEYCGGLQSIVNNTNGTNSNSTVLARIRRATTSPNILLTVYSNLNASPDPQPAPALGNPSTVIMTETIMATAMTTITSTLSYTTVCSTNPASLVVVEYCSTFTVEDCGCASQTQPEIAMATVVNSCDACGAAGESVVTLTVPAALVAAATANAAAAVSTANPAAAVTAAANVTTASTSVPAVVTAAAGISAVNMELVATIEGVRQAANPVDKPSAALIQELVNGAIDLGDSDYEHEYVTSPKDKTRTFVKREKAPNCAQGFGMVNLERSMASLTDFGSFREGQADGRGRLTGGAG